MKTVLTIAGSDCSGGAGIQADIKTMTANGVYAMSAITALVAENTVEVADILESPPEFLEKELDCIFTDIEPDAIKIGMVPGNELVQKIVQKLKQYNAKNIVVDPVMVATCGSDLIDTSAIAALKSELLPMATLVTPNIPEAEILSGKTIRNDTDMEEAARMIFETYGCAVLCKGGHSVNDANDLLYQASGATWLYGIRVETPNTHGTGCTLSSAIAANLAKGFSLMEAAARAKAYLSGALAAGLCLGRGSGPMMHGFDIHSAYADMPKSDC